MNLAVAHSATVGEIFIPVVLVDGALNYHQLVDECRRDILEIVLIATDGNRTQAARLLGLQRTYLLRLIRTLQPDIPAPRRGVKA